MHFGFCLYYLCDGIERKAINEREVGRAGEEGETIHYTHRQVPITHETSFSK